MIAATGVGDGGIAIRSGGAEIGRTGRKTPSFPAVLHAVLIAAFFSRAAWILTGRIFHPFAETAFYGNAFFASGVVLTLLSFGVFRSAYAGGSEEGYRRKAPAALFLSIVTLGISMVMRPDRGAEALALLGLLNLVLHCPIPNDEAVPEEAELPPLPE